MVRRLLPTLRPNDPAGRNAMIRRAAYIVLIAVLTLGLGSTSGLSQGGKVAMLLPGSINDQSWNAAGYAGLVKLKDKGFEIVLRERAGGRSRRGHEGLCAARLQPRHRPLGTVSL